MSDSHLLDELRTSLVRLRETARAATDRIENDDPAEDDVAHLAELAGRTELLLARLVEKRNGGGPATPAGSENALAEAQELLGESLQQLQTAQEYAKVSLLRMGAWLDERIQGEKGARAYQARGSA
jgi:hypothetical protein